jgi:hypothetical protein
MFLAINADAIIKPSLPKAACSMLREVNHPTRQAATVDTAAVRKEARSGPHRDKQSRKSAPNKIKGVAICKDSNCRDFAAAVPPGWRTPIDANKKVKAMAVTGGPKRRPMRVFLPITCETVAVPVKAAMFPQVSVGPIKEAAPFRLDDNRSADKK